GAEQAVEAAEARQQFAAELHRAAAGHAGAQEDREQLGFRQGAGTQLEQSLARTLFRRPIGNAHKLVLCRKLLRSRCTVMSLHIKLRHAAPVSRFCALSTEVTHVPIPLKT